MNIMELNYWYVRGNELSISLMKFCVKITIINSSLGIYYQLRIKDNNEMYLNMNFNSLEEAVLFTENGINKCHNFQEVINKYKEMNNKRNYDTSWDFPAKNESHHTISLTPQEVDEAIINYFGKDKPYRISVKDEISWEDGNIFVKLILIKHLAKEDKETLTYEQIKQATNEYIGKDEYKVVSFNYNIVFDDSEDEPLHYWIDLNVDKKEKKLCKKR